MKKYFSMILVIIFSISLISCENIDQNKMAKVKSPVNESLSIEGVWEVADYKVLDKTVYKEDENNISIGDKIDIAHKYIKVKDKEYFNVDYKLKLVEDDYVISYEANYTIKDLELNKNKNEVMSIIHKNNILFEFIKESSNKGFIFYNGALYEIKLVDKIKNNNYQEEKKTEDDLYTDKINKEYNAPVGIYLGIKSKSIYEESYKTIYISFKDGLIQPIKEKNGLITPRMSGIWSIDKKTIDDKDYHNEYLEALPIGAKNEKEYTENNTEKNNDSTYRSINYVGNDYIATEVYKGKNFNGEYNKYEVIPIDNITSDLPIVISDIFSSEANNLMKESYEQIIKILSRNGEEKRYSQYINYSNFSVKRDNGKWIVIGKISPAYGEEGTGYDYPLNIKPSKKLINYDSLLIPWKTLKSEVPLTKDAFTSPNGRLAIISTTNKIFVYEIKNSKISGNPLISIDIDENDEIIMSEWCTGDYVEKWEKPFLQQDN